MKSARIFLLAGALFIFLFSSLVYSGVPQLMNYQGKLTTPTGALIDSTLSMVFSIYDNLADVSPVWAETLMVQVEKGIFSVVLGNVHPIPNDVFDGTVQYLGVKAGSDPEMTPRKEIVSVGYAYRAAYAEVAVSDGDWTFRITDTADTTLMTGGEWGIARAGNVLYGNKDSTHVNLGVACTTGSSGQNYKYCTVAGGGQNKATNAYATVGGGLANKATSSLGVVAGGQSNTAGGTHQSTVGGGYKNTASGNYSTVAGGYADTASGENATVGGGERNKAGNVYATVGGGLANKSTSSCGVVAGGMSNTAGGVHQSTVGGGYKNTASSNYTTVAGGYADTASGEYATIGGGHKNKAIGENATIGGGKQNNATGDHTAVGGGYNNTASAIYATVAGGGNNTANALGAAVGGGNFNNATRSNATVAGGSSNTASGDHATVGGGVGNSANSDDVTIGGGWYNSASGARATIGGGYKNMISARGATIPGGYQDTVAGEYSFATGIKVKLTSTANYTFAFGRDFTTSTPNAVIFHNSVDPIKVGIGTTTPQGALDVNSTTGALIVPRMTTAQRDALSAVNGMIIYNTTTNQFNFYENGAWVTK